MPKETSLIIISLSRLEQVRLMRLMMGEVSLEI